MDNGKKKLDATGVTGMALGILSIVCIAISFLSYAGIKFFCLQIESILIMLFLIIALCLAIVGIIFGFDGRRRWALGQSADGNLTGSGAIVLGFVTIGCAAILFLILEVQGGTDLLIKKEAKLPDTAQQTEQQLKEKISKTSELVNIILPHARSYAKMMEEDSAQPSIEKLAVKYGFDQKDAWGNDIIVKFEKRLDENGDFAGWGAQVSSAGPDGKPGTDDDIKPDKK